MTRTNPTLEIPADDFAAANERLAKIGLAPTVETRDEQLAADIAEVVSEAQRPALAEQLARTPTQQTETSTPESRARKTRSDAGKPRQKFYLSIPGVRFDMDEAEGRVAFHNHLDKQVADGQVDAVGAIVRALLREIDRD
jgi:hypothetical protein